MISLLFLKVVFSKLYLEFVSKIVHKGLSIFKGVVQMETMTVMSSVASATSIIQTVQLIPEVPKPSKICKALFTS